MENPEPSLVTCVSILFTQDKFDGNIYSKMEGIRYYNDNHLGTPQVLTDENGQIAWYGDYEPFGEVNILVERTTNNFRFPGQYFIEETGLHYNWNRWYYDKTGRYIQVDRFLEINREYVYTGSNTINRYDLFGLYDCASGWHDCESLREDLRRTADEYCDEDIAVPYQEGCYCKFYYCVCYKNAEKGDPNRKILTKCKCVEYKSKNCRIA